MGFEHIGFIGLGLIGGSVAKSIKKHCPGSRIYAYDTNKAALMTAKEMNVIDHICEEINADFSKCDVIILAGPVAVNNENVKLLKPFLSEACILTDIGSVKQNIHNLIRELKLEKQFIGGHPMAGSENSGFLNSTDHLIENAYYLLTPSQLLPKDTIKSMYDFISSLGAIPLVLDYKEHDYITAAISHLPHIVAASLVNVIKSLDSKEELMKMLAAGGFKDITRIASSSPVMWQQICSLNGRQILEVMEHYIDILLTIKKNINENDGGELYAFFQSAMEYRNSIPHASLGSIKKEYVIYCDVKDEAGAIATIATILACNQISIKNIGIVNNREFEEAVLRIEFYKENSLLTAVDLLEKHRYTLYVR